MMQLSYNVIKRTAINDKVVLPPPSIDKFIDTAVIKNNDEIKIDEIVENIKNKLYLKQKNYK
ncbi:hypothetical protein PL321_16240 [Caloramator sp. mosi_1]|uniref:hypothetical protein n=1 Tax=Caloramator sp. mosi_1 TaxID=3023090 RepID=UPI00235FF3F1|nr:hypothetical protein [Caloramator sp. mosi_1]WDC83935.1 hypothetical protein PL321_16240 [Caloramator sp. mosi_1]